MSDDQILVALEAMGDAEARRRLASGVFGPRKRPLVEEWLRSRDAASSAASRAEALDINRALAISTQRANTIAVAAVVMATISVIVTVLDKIGLLG